MSSQTLDHLLEQQNIRLANAKVAAHDAQQDIVALSASVEALRHARQLFAERDARHLKEVEALTARIAELEGKAPPAAEEPGKPVATATPPRRE